MKKFLSLISITALLVAFIFIMTPSSAFCDHHLSYGGTGIGVGGIGIGGQGGNATGGSVGNVSVGGGGQQIDTTVNSFSPTAIATVEQGAVVNNVSPSATIEKGAVKNVNKNLNFGINAQKQGQTIIDSGNATIEKGAVVAKGGSVKNSGNVTNSGNSESNSKSKSKVVNSGNSASKSKSDLTLTQIYEDKRDHITGPAILKSDAKLSNGRVDRIKLFGLELLNEITQLTQAQADKLASQASDIKVEKALIFENAFELDKVKFGKAGEFMGYLYVLPDGTDCNAAAMIGKVSRAAMKAGATHIELVRVSSADHATGSAWNVGIGGGASIMSNSETVAIAPNGGLGYGKAKASNEARPSLAFGAYFDKTLLTTSYRIVKKDLGYSAEDK